MKANSAIAIIAQKWSLPASRRPACSRRRAGSPAARRIRHVAGSLAVVFLIAFTHAAPAADDFLDRLDDFLAVSAFHGNVRVRASGLLDLESYYVPQPPPGLIETDENFLFNPRLTLFLDAQIGPRVYAFAEARADRGFDPHERGADARLDEYAVRISPWDDGRFNVQVGKFATVVGNWVQRHQSWDNPFITAPLPYENVTAISDKKAPGSPQEFLGKPSPETEEYEYAKPGESAGEYSQAGGGGTEKYERNPIIWGPSYASGLAVFGAIGKFDYAAEIKNASLSSRPESWDATEIGWEHPTFSGRLGFRPNEMWNLGFSTSAGPYLRPEAAATLPAGRGIGDYREVLFGQDIGFAWHHLQLWAEFYETRFEVPRVGNADTFAYYIEAKYKFTPQFFGALRWNQQFFATVPGGEGGREPWGDDLWRIDLALGYRFTPHTQLKLQYSVGRQESDSPGVSHTVAGQLTVKF
jgi:hypothetical protein